MSVLHHLNQTSILLHSSSEFSFLFFLNYTTMQSILIINRACIRYGKLNVIVSQYLA